MSPARIARYLRTSSVHVRALLVVCFCALCFGVYLLLSQQADQSFDLDYAAYEKVALADDNAAYIPGAQSNPVRVALDQTLTQVLDQHASNTARLTNATQGLAILTQSESQIADISSTTAAVDTLIAKMQVDMLRSAIPSDKGHAILELAKQRSSIISDIRAYSYRTDLEIQEIFTTIIAAHGALSDSYIISLNAEIPDVEKEFDKRSDLYLQLQSTADSIESTYASTRPQSAP